MSRLAVTRQLVAVSLLRTNVSNPREFPVEIFKDTVALRQISYRVPRFTLTPNSPYCLSTGLVLQVR